MTTEADVCMLHAGVGFRMPLAPSLTPLQAMRQQLISRSLAGLGAADAAEAAAANERQPAAGAKAAPQPPLAPRRVSLSVRPWFAAHVSRELSLRSFVIVRLDGFRQAPLSGRLLWLHNVLVATLQWCRASQCALWMVQLRLACTSAPYLCLDMDP